MRSALARLSILALALGAACGGDKSPTAPGSGSPSPIPGTVVTLPVIGHGDVTSRFTAEVWVQGNTAYTTTWGNRGGVRGNTTFVWDMSATPRLVDSLLVSDATTLGDVQTTDDGKFLVVATEIQNGSIVIYDLSDPRHPAQVTRYQTAETLPGVHTATVSRVNGRQYAFLCIDPNTNTPAHLTIVDITDPAHPFLVWSQPMGAPFIHDVFVRDGLLFTAEWDDGLGIWDIGGGGASGSPLSPVRLGRVATIGGEVHNVWWFHDSTGDKRYAFVGQEGPGAIGSSSVGDIHVVDVSDPRNSREVAFFDVPGAGTHNFSVDETHGILYAAFYNGGVRALSIRGDLSTCTAAQKAADGRCDLGKMGREIGRGLLDQNRSVYIWGVYYVGGVVYASDMLSGIWKLTALQ